MTMADRIAVMAGGQLQQVGTPAEVYGRPRNLFVARFLGSPPMNTLAAAVVHEGGGPWVRVGDAGRLRLDPAAAPADGEATIVGVRPEHLAVAGPQAGDGGLAATVTAVEWLGHEQHVVCAVGDERIMVRLPTDLEAPSPGAALTLAATPDRLHLFDPATTERRA
jgi:multiple sugar transport system ATP-binding protein